MRLLVTGARDWKDYKVVHRELLKIKHLYGAKVTLVHGDCRGLDRMAGAIGRGLGFRIEAVPAEWDRYGLSAGPKRNEKMIETYRPDYAIAFHTDLEHSKGTKDCVHRIEARGIPYHVVKR